MNNMQGFNMSQQNLALDHKSKTIFVGNISYDSSEDELRDLFSRVGPISNFKIIYDRDTGKPKGYGFIEFGDPEVALSAQRNLNDVEFHGRQLRVSITHDQFANIRNDSLPPPNVPPVSLSSDTAANANVGPAQPESQFGPSVEPSEAPEAITKAVASLPPEQMYELMTQMKLVIQNNPAEARQMLLQNPQLAYALLQAQIVMKIVDPQVAMAMLHRENVPSAPIMPNVSIPGLFIAPGSAPQPKFDPRNQRFMAPRGMNLQAGTGGRFIPPPQQMRHPGPGPTNLPERFPVNRPAGPRPSNFPSASTQPGAVPVVDPAILAGTGGVRKEKDQEKAMLIMQVLQLSDEQIASLPPEQRQSIMVLKEQFSKNQ